MKDLGATRRILGIDAKRNRKEGTLSLSQSGNIAKVLKEFGMMEAKTMSTPIPTHYKLKSTKNTMLDSDF